MPPKGDEAGTEAPQRIPGGLTEGISLGEADNALLSMFTDEPDLMARDLDADDDGQDHDDVDDDDDVEQDDDDDLEDDDSEEEYDDEDESEGEDEDDEADDGADESDEPQTYKVKVAGEEEEVTLDDALAGYMRRQDYTQKTMALADLRKEIGEKSANLAAVEKEYAENLQLVEQVLTGGLGTDPDWAALKQSNPKDYQRIREAWIDRQDQLRALKEEKDRVQRAYAARMEDAKQEKIKHEQDLLLAAIPEWVDQAVASKEIESVVMAAQAYGIAPEELDTIMDHRMILILRDAARARAADEASDKGKDILRKTRKKSTTLKSGVRKSKSKTSSRKGTRGARKRLNQTGHIRDAEAVLAGMFDNL